MQPTLTQSTDAELIQLTRTGDKTAFGELIRRYQGLVYGLAYHRIGNFTDAQDIAQEVFIKVFRRLDQLEQPERFAAWVRTAVVNECRMWVRANRPSVPLEEAETLPVYTALAVDGWRRRERHSEIRRAVDSLPEKSRLIVTLHYLSGLSHQEIGEFLGMAANAVSQHLHRARRQLKEMLMAEIEEDYAMNKLTEQFAQEVLERVSLYPRTEGMFCRAEGENDTAGMIMGVGACDPKESYITIWMKNKDLDDITLGTLPRRRTEEPKGRAMESALQMLDAFGIEIRQVVLRLAEDRKCRAAVDLKQGDTEMTLDMRPSDAMGLAVRVNAPILVEEPVVRAGNVGEDDVHVPDEPMDMPAYKLEFEKQRQHEVIRDKALEIGLSVEDQIDTVRFRKDEANRVLRMWIEAIPEREATFDLKEYSLGVDFIFDLAQRRGTTGLLQDGDMVLGWKKEYTFRYSLLNDDVRMRVVLEEGNTQPQSGEPAW